MCYNFGGVVFVGGGSVGCMYTSNNTPPPNPTTTHTHQRTYLYPTPRTRILAARPTVQLCSGMGKSPSSPSPFSSPSGAPSVGVAGPGDGARLMEAPGRMGVCVLLLDMVVMVIVVVMELITFFLFLEMDTYVFNYCAGSMPPQKKVIVPPHYTTPTHRSAAASSAPPAPAPAGARPGASTCGAARSRPARPPRRRRTRTHRRGRPPLLPRPPVWVGVDGLIALGGWR